MVGQPFALPSVGGDGRDIGAYELPAQTTPTVLTVNSLADANPPAGVLTLRQALQAADGLIAADRPARRPGRPRALRTGSRCRSPFPGRSHLASALPAVTYAVSIQGARGGGTDPPGRGTIVRSVTVTYGGSGYTTPPVVTFTPAPPGGTTATGVATVQNGQVVGVTITNPGFGYTAVPTVSFGGPGTGASAFATLAADPVLSVAIGATAGVAGLTVDGNQGVNAGVSVAAGGNLVVKDAVIQRGAAATTAAAFSTRAGPSAWSGRSS